MTEITTKTSSRSVPETVRLLTTLVEERGLKLFAVFDHSGEAAKIGLALRETNVVAFGSPEAGTPVMEAVPLAALDLPLKVLVWDDDGMTKVSYTSPDALAQRYGIPSDLASRIAGIDALTDAVVR